jgi:hypothetical protein
MRLKLENNQALQQQSESNGIRSISYGHSRNIQTEKLSGYSKCTEIKAQYERGVPAELRFRRNAKQDLQATTVKLKRSTREEFQMN